MKDDIWEYLYTTLLPSVYNVPSDESDEAQFYLSDLTTAIIGVPRIRQLRIDHGKKCIYLDEQVALHPDRNDLTIQVPPQTGETSPCLKQV